MPPLSLCERPLLDNVLAQVSVKLKTIRKDIFSSVFPSATGHLPEMVSQLFIQLKYIIPQVRVQASLVQGDGVKMAVWEDAELESPQN